MATLGYTFGQQPQGKVQANIGTNALHWAGALAATVRAAATQATFGEVFSHTVRRHDNINFAPTIDSSNTCVSIVPCIADRLGIFLAGV